MKEILLLEDINLTYHTLQGEIKALENLNISVNEKEFVSIVGPSGCGKTTILSLISGLLTPSSGKILYYGKESQELKKNIGYMFQKDHLFEWRTVYKNIMLGPEIQGKKDSPEQNQHINNLLENYGLAGFRDNYPRQLSGGMRQRVALIRTLALNPSILLLDEPFSALDYQTRLAVSDDVSEIISKEEKTAILVTHDIAEAISMSDRIIVLTKRPGSVKTVFEVNLKKYGSPFKRRECPEFQVLFDKIWEALQDEEEKKE